MNSKILIYILLTLFSLFSFACSVSQAASEDRAEVVFDDGKHSSSGDEVVIDDNDLNLKGAQNTNSSRIPEEMTENLGDSSEVTTRFDGYGNKIETRKFQNHPRLDLILLRTSTDGKREILVYGFGKEVKSLPPEMIDRALTASGDELANAAGLYETRSYKETKNFMKPESKPLQPLPSSAFPITTTAPPQSVQPEIASPAPNTESSSEEDSANPQPIKESAKKDVPPDEEK